MGVRHVLDGGNQRIPGLDRPKNELQKAVTRRRRMHEKKQKISARTEKNSMGHIIGE